MTDNVTKPAHYMLMDGKLETIDLIKDRCNNLPMHLLGHTAYCYGNTIKYLMRWPHKNGVEDLRKCRQYIDMLLEELV